MTTDYKAAAAADKEPPEAEKPGAEAAGTPPARDCDGCSGTGWKTLQVPYSGQVAWLQGTTETGVVRCPCTRRLKL